MWAARAPGCAGSRHCPARKPQPERARSVRRAQRGQREREQRALAAEEARLDPAVAPAFTDHLALDQEAVALIEELPVVRLRSSPTGCRVPSSGPPAAPRTHAASLRGTQAASTRRAWSRLRSRTLAERSRVGTFHDENREEPAESLDASSPVAPIGSPRHVLARAFRQGTSRGVSTRSSRNVPRRPRSARAASSRAPQASRARGTPRRPTLAPPRRGRVRACARPARRALPTPPCARDGRRGTGACRRRTRGAGCARG